MKIKVFILLLVLTSPFIYGQNDFEDFKNEISALKGKAKANKYIEIIKEQTTRQPQIAVSLAEEALKDGSISNLETETAVIRYLLGDLYYLTGDFTQSLPHLQSAVDKLEELDDRTMLPQAYIGLGRYYRKTQEDCQKAEEYYLQAGAIYKKDGNLQEYATVQNYLGNIAQACEKDFDKALSFYKETEKYYTEVNDTLGLSYSLDFISQIYGEQDKADDAIALQNKALELRLAINDVYASAISYTNLGELYKQKNELNSSGENFKKAYEISAREDYKGLTAYLLGNLSEISLSQSDYQKAYDLLLEQKELEDEILDEEKHKQLAEMQTKYETEKKELALSEEKVKNKNKNLALMLMGTALFLLAILIAWFVQRRKLDKQVALIDNLKNLEEERTRIARDLHDNLGAELTMISSKLDLKAYAATNEADKNDLEEIREVSTNANNVLRETIWSIHRQELTIDELYQKTKEYAKRILSEKEIKLSVNATDRETKLSPALALHLFRVIQESVNNAGKYSECTELDIKMSNSRIRVSDNGAGFDEDIISRGYGMENMKWRAKEINGKININSKIGKGTIIELTYPKPA